MTPGGTRTLAVVNLMSRAMETFIDIIGRKLSRRIATKDIVEDDDGTRI
jgi:hypothetical protein